MDQPMKKKRLVADENTLPMVETPENCEGGIEYSGPDQQDTRESETGIVAGSDDRHNGETIAKERAPDVSHEDRSRMPVVHEEASAGRRNQHAHRSQNRMVRNRSQHDPSQ